MERDRPPADGPTFYDDPDVFDRYTRMREAPGNANETLEQPELDELVGNPRGVRVLDLGCGAGAFGRDLLARGAARYVGVDGSTRMVESAREHLAGTAAEIRHGDLATLSVEPASFDLVTSRLALHYIPELSHVFSTAWNALVPGGRMVFSVEHPVITSCARSWTDGKRADWIVDDYFRTGRRQTDWMGATVTKYHRTLQELWDQLRAAGFVVDDLREGRPRRASFSDEAEYERRRRIPLFLIIAAHRPLERHP
jgi:SAM-dependent methyltransferase